LTYLPKGSIAHHSGNFNDAMQYCSLAHKLFIGLNDKDSMAAAKVYFGFIYRFMGE